MLVTPLDHLSSMYCINHDYCNRTRYIGVVEPKQGLASILDRYTLAVSDADVCRMAQA
jgi:hypothetical protein